MKKTLGVLSILALLAASPVYATEGGGDGGGNGDGGSTGNPSPAPVGPQFGCSRMNEPGSELGTCFYDVVSICNTVPGKGRQRDGEACDWRSDPTIMRAQ